MGILRLPHLYKLFQEMLEKTGNNSFEIKKETERKLKTALIWKK